MPNDCGLTPASPARPSLVRPANEAHLQVRLVGVELAEELLDCAVAVGTGLCTATPRRVLSPAAREGG